MTMKTEKQLQDYLRKQCLVRGISFDKVESRSRRGFPDIFMARDGQVVLAELKSPAGTGKVSALQQRCIDDLLAHGVVTYIIDSVDGVGEIIDLFEGV